MTARPPILSAEHTGDGIDAATDAARRVIQALLSTASDTDAGELADVAAQLGDIAKRVESQAPPVEERMVDMWRGEGVTRHDPVTGPENAIAPPLSLHGIQDGSVEGVVTLDLPYQGPPGYVHGGISALLLDHTLGVANHWGGASGMTAELTLRYHRPTPLFTPLTVAGRQVDVDGRKIRTVGSIAAGDTVCVSANALFISKDVPRPGR